MDKFDKYYSFRLTYPFNGNKIYRSKSKDKVIKKCYHEYKTMLNETNNTTNNNIFGITDLDNKIEYRFILK